MEIKNDQWAIFSACTRKKKINPQPQYQRTQVWSVKKKQDLIDSILRGYDVPKFYLRTTSNALYEQEVVDGQQRLNAIWGFVEGEFKLGPTSRDLQDGDLYDVGFADLSSDMKDQFHGYNLHMVIIQDATELEIRDLFLRLQEGVPLSPTEKRNAMPGNMRDFVASTADTHAVFPLTCIKNDRFSWHEIVAIITKLEIEGGPSDVKGNALSWMYRHHVDFDLQSGPAKRVVKVLNFICKVLKPELPEMRVKWGFVDLYLLFSLLEKDYALNKEAKRFREFFIELESERIKGQDALDRNDEWDNDLFLYIEAFKKGSGDKNNIKIRHEVCTRRLLRKFKGIVAKDPKRDFSKMERLVIWRKFSGICQACKKKFKFSDIEADHIKPHSKGGMTTMENGQPLCKSCNSSKKDN